VLTDDPRKGEDGDENALNDELRPAGPGLRLPATAHIHHATLITNESVTSKRLFSHIQLERDQFLLY
jgi:hypothetical protein